MRQYDKNDKLSLPKINDLYRLKLKTDLSSEIFLDNFSLKYPKTAKVVKIHAALTLNSEIAWDAILYTQNELDEINKNYQWILETFFTCRDYQNKLGI